MNEAELLQLIDRCRKKDRSAQRALYEHFKGKMFGVCLRYANTREEAEDLLQEGFVKVFRDIHQFQGLGSFEGWVRKIMVNVSLHYIQKQRKRMEEEAQYIAEYQPEYDEPSVFDTENTPQAIIKLMQKMPPGFRTILNLYVLENYTHPQIAEALGISVGTSKSQLNRAKAFLRALLENNLA